MSPVAAAFLGVVLDGGVDRAALSKAVLGADKTASMAVLEAIVHPLVSARREAFMAAHASSPLVVLDVPLLFETGGEALCDAVAVASTGDEAVQRQRVLSRPGMSPQKLDAVLAKQLPDAQKRARAQHVISTGCAIDDTRRAVMELVRTITTQPRADSASAG